MGDAAGKVFLVGAGPGAPDLITVRGAKVLKSAQVVVYDGLVHSSLLALAPADAELIDAGKRGGGKKNFAQAEINELLIERARIGKRVVRLKGGDPFIFGRGGEEAEALVDAGIAFEIVPGITSAIAAPAFAGIPLTHREHGSFVAFVTGHEDTPRADASKVPWGELARAAEDGTIVILMAAARMRATLKRLLDAGSKPETPAAAIQWATTAGQRTVIATVADLSDAAERVGLGSPAVIVVGECARLRNHLAWVEQMPLFGRRIVVTRATDQAAALADRLRALGAEVIEFPAIAFAPPADFALLDRAIDQAASFEWIIFTSARGVDAFMQRLSDRNRDVREFGQAAVAAIGPATAARVRHYGLRVAAMPSEYRAEAIIDAIGAERIVNARVLIPRAEIAREILPAMLRAQGAREVIVAPAYRTIRPADKDVSGIRQMIEAEAIDLLTFTSASTVNNFCAVIGGRAKRVKAAAIGPITAAAAREHGLEVVAMPSSYTVDALVEAIRIHLAVAPASMAPLRMTNGPLKNPENDS